MNFTVKELEDFCYLYGPKKAVKFVEVPSKGIIKCFDEETRLVGEIKIKEVSDFVEY